MKKRRFHWKTSPWTLLREIEILGLRRWLWYQVRERGKREGSVCSFSPTLYCTMQDIYIGFREAKSVIIYTYDGEKSALYWGKIILILWIENLHISIRYYLITITLLALQENIKMALSPIKDQSLGSFELLGAIKIEESKRWEFKNGCLIIILDLLENL